MSIKTEIARIQSNVTNALSAAAAKGGTVPSGSGSDQLASVISSIPDVTFTVDTSGNATLTGAGFAVDTAGNATTG